LTLSAVVTLTWFESSHQSDFSAVSECNLLMTTTHAEDRLARMFDDVKNSRERLGRILVPRMTLSTQDYVRRPQTADSLERYTLERFDEDFEAGNQATQHRAKLARAGALTINCVVDKVN
jgi:hypothetical protein